MDLFRMFPTDEAAEQWFIRQRWGDEIACVKCGSCNVNPKTAHKTMPHRCRDCDKRFSVRMGTVMESSKLSYQVWAIAIYALTTGIKGVSSMKLHRDLNITQKSAWFLAHRIREAFTDKQADKLSGDVEVDETYVGGQAKNKYANKRFQSGRGTAGKFAVMGAKEHTGKVIAKPLSLKPGATFAKFVYDHVEPCPVVYTDDHKGYAKLEGQIPFRPVAGSTCGARRTRTGSHPSGQASSAATRAYTTTGTASISTDTSGSTPPGTTCAAWAL